MDRFLIFGYLNNNQSYNWVEFKSFGPIQGKVSGELMLKDINNNILNVFSIVAGKMVRTVNIQTKVTTLSIGSPIPNYVACPDCSLPEVIVTAYLSSGSISNFWSLYWLLNQNYDYLTFYNNDGRAGGGGGEVATIYPKTLNSKVGEIMASTLNSDGSTTLKVKFRNFIVAGGIATVESTFVVNANSWKSTSPPATASIVSGVMLGSYTLTSAGSYYYSTTNILEIYLNMGDELPYVGANFTFPEQWTMYLNFNSIPWSIKIKR